MNGENTFNKPMRNSGKAQFKSKAKWQGRNTFYVKMVDDSDERPIVWIVKAVISEDGKTISYSSSVGNENELKPLRSMTLRKISE